MDYIKLAYTSASFQSQPPPLTQMYVIIIEFVISANIKIEYTVFSRWYYHDDIWCQHSNVKILHIHSIPSSLKYYRFRQQMFLMFKPFSSLNVPKKSIPIRSSRGYSFGKMTCLVHVMATRTPDNKLGPYRPYMSMIYTAKHLHLQLWATKEG